MEAAYELGVHVSAVSALFRDGHLTRIRRGRRVYAYRYEVLSYKDRRDWRKANPLGSSALSKSEQRAIVETLLLCGVITRADIADLTRERIARALKRVTA